MTAFEFTPGGIKEMGAGLTVAPAVIPASSVIASIRAQAAKAVAPAVTAPEAKALSVLDRRNFVKELRARLKLVEREIKRLRTLEDERDELRRLLAAAKAPPAKVRDITTARKSG